MVEILYLLFNNNRETESQSVPLPQRRATVSLEFITWTGKLLQNKQKTKQKKQPKTQQKLLSKLQLFFGLKIGGCDF